MYSEKHLKCPGNLPVAFSPIRVALLALAVSVVLWAVPSLAQSSSSDQNSPQSQSQPTQSQQEHMPAAAGGPTGDSGPIAVPKKSDSDETPPPPKPKVTDRQSGIFAACGRSGGDGRRSCAAEGWTPAIVAGRCGQGALQDLGRWRAAENSERDRQQSADYGGVAGRVRGHQLQLHV